MREKLLLRGTDEHLGKFVLGVRFDMRVVKRKDHSRVAPVRVGGPLKFSSIMEDILEDCFEQGGMITSLTRKHRSNRLTIVRTGITRQMWKDGQESLRKLGYVVVPVQRFRRLWH